MGELQMKQKALSIREYYELYAGNELKYIIKRRKLMAKKPTYDVYVEDGVAATAEVTNTASPLTFKLTFGDKDGGEVTFAGIPGVNRLEYAAKDITIDGNSLLTEFTVKTSDKKTIGTIKKKIVSVGDTYDVSFENDGDELLFAVLALLTDETFHG